MAARLVDYEGAKHGVAMEQPKKSGCAVWFIIIVIVLAAGAFAAWDSFGSLLEKSGDSSSPAPIVETLEANAPEPVVTADPNPPSQAEAKFTDPYTLTVRVVEPAHVKITQQADGKVLVDELVKPAIPINAVAKSAIVVESNKVTSVQVQVGNMIYQTSSPYALSFIVSPKEGH